MTCKHMAFNAVVEVARLEDTGRFLAHVRIRCTQCDLPFQFLGMEPGLHMAGARVSIDGQEARIAIAPEGATPSPLQSMVHNVKAFDA